MKNLIKKNLIYEKPQNYAKIQLHNKEINSKLGNTTVPPERYHQSKLIKAHESKIEKLMPTVVQPKESQSQFKTVAAKANKLDAGDRQVKNDLLS